MNDIEKAFANAKANTKTVKICLRGDLAGEFEELDEQLQELIRDQDTAPSLASGSRKREIAERMAELREQMKAEAVPFELKAMGRKAWQKLVDSHPPRQDVDLDRLRGFNDETFFPALIRASVVEPQLSDQQWTQLLDEDMLSPGQYEELANAAWALNRRGGDVPFSHAALLTLGRSEPASNQPSGSE